MKAFVTVIGKDKIGIIQHITAILAENNVNILDINQTLLHGYFTMIMFVDLNKMEISVEELKDKLEEESKKIGVTTRIQREDLFNYMYEI